MDRRTVAERYRLFPIFLIPIFVKNSFQNIEGTFDIYPGAQRATECTEIWSYLEGIIDEMMANYGYSEIRTPTLEHTGLIARGVGQTTDIVSKEMFAFERGNHSYVLRPEMTAPIMRAYLQHHLDQNPGVQRYYYIGPCFRAERPQKGRYRQFHQFGAEVIGTDDPRADAEVIALMTDLYQVLGIGDTTLKINTLGNAEARATYRDALVGYLTPFAEQLTQISRDRLSQNPLRILDTKVEAERVILENAPLITEYIDEESAINYESIKRLISSVGIPFVEDPMLVRGLDYYSHFTFEFEVKGIGAQNALAGGGRYDSLAPEIGAKAAIPAIGFAAGVERLILALENQDLCKEHGSVKYDVWIIAVGDMAHEKAFQVASQMRKSHLRVGMELGHRSMKAQLRLANRANSTFAIIIGDQEVKADRATVKDMETGQELEVFFSDLVERITKSST